MIIGLNGQKLLASEPTGVENYTFEVFKALSKIDKENKYIIYFEKEPPESYFEEITNLNPNFTFKVIKKILSWTQVGLALELLKNPIDIFFTTIHTIPGLPALLSRKIKFVSVIHGLEFKANKDSRVNFIKKTIHPWILWFTIKFSKTVIVPSQATKDAILKTWKDINKDRMVVIPEGVDEKFLKVKPGKKSNYLFAVSTIQPRKNYPKMIEGFALALESKKIPSNTKLLIAGKLGWEYEESLAAPKKFGIEDNVEFLGHAPENKLLELLSRSYAFISTSLEEGFGLPLLESMASKTLTVVSDIPSYREVGADFPIYVNPKNPEDIKRGIIEVFSLRESEKREKLTGAKDRAAGFTWNLTAQRILASMI